ncbi:hypothetical protein ACDP63_08515 [Paracoccus sp. P2]|uniref:Uncharacterized protein n=2 Tax=Paracoccus pantotrophus TaxID=82367 RepID=A0A1I5JY19_PARPN|nr:hypothetical protein [Paracoccus pantotrophus]MDF3855498.1 hypothetical protein [Paracoccus pantotrophus]QFG37234.1 hypothetical protein ESD82_13745 [Paracoccus pantotrophus]QLH14793.1 hypothetical protein HYQ43_10875 [Paracoccus pantotrophus]RDD99743.1 hypothetical protein DTW92_03085 [Paracoccus pantotrophus]RKS52339.1 hypothetical protein BDE18_1662 [Paracoccus pantotrophus]
MHHQDDQPPITRTPADETSQTRFGPRPVPEGHRRPPGPAESRRIPPHGDVSPDGSHPWPRPSRGAKWLVWGGTGLAAAALTAGTVIAARHMIDLIAGDDPGRPRRPDADRRPGSGPMERQARPEPDRRPKAKAAARHVPQGQRRPPRQSLLQEVEANTASLTSGVENVMQALTAAVTGFRSVAGQASTIMQEFGDAATIMRSIIDRKPAPQRRGPSQRRQGAQADRADDITANVHHDARMPDLRDDPLLHDPMEGPDPGGPADHDPRVHRL